MKINFFITVIIWFFVFLFLIINLIKRNKIRFLPSLFILLFILFFSILTPSGEVFFSLGKIKITSESLLLGFQKSGILIGMVFLSKIIVNPNKQFHGKLGRKIGKIFFYLNLLTEKKIVLKKNQIIKSIDDLLCEIWQKEIPEDDELESNDYKFGEDSKSESINLLFDPTKGPCNN